MSSNPPPDPPDIEDAIDKTRHNVRILREGIETLDIKAHERDEVKTCAALYTIYHHLRRVEGDLKALKGFAA